MISQLWMIGTALITGPAVPMQGDPVKPAHLAIPSR
jgi:hypothetical protein